MSTYCKKSESILCICVSFLFKIKIDLGFLRVCLLLKYHIKFLFYNFLCILCSIKTKYRKKNVINKKYLFRSYLFSFNVCRSNILTCIYPVFPIFILYVYKCTSFLTEHDSCGALLMVIDYRLNS